MGREVRRVTPHFKHPEIHGSFLPLEDDYEEALERFNDRVQAHGLSEAAAYFGGQPNPAKFIDPRTPKSEKTWYMMYENTTEGTPISPSFETPEELARWLADSGASAFGSMKATYEEWLATIRNGSAPSAVFSQKTGLQSGVEAAGDKRD
jgi:hypothetical protein